MSEPRTSNHVEEPSGPLATALLREHHDIDAGIEAFTALAETPAQGPVSDWAQPLIEAMRALRRHIYLEEEIVFPKLRVGGLMMAIMVMIREHGELWRAMDALDAALAAEGAGSDTVSRDALIASCRTMLALLDEHNMKEEPVIYTHLDSDLDTETAERLEAFLADGALPDGWVCEALRA